MDTSLQDAIDKNLCAGNHHELWPVRGAIRVPYLASDETLALQANAEGITWLAATGDAGAGDCEDVNAVIAQNGFAVDAPASIPEVTAMGGSEFNEGNGSYWNDTNSATGASALSYIPERVWNDSELGSGLAAGGGGTSLFFPQPAGKLAPAFPHGLSQHTRRVAGFVRRP